MKDGNSAFQGLTLSTTASKATILAAQSTRRITTFAGIALLNRDLTPPRPSLMAGRSIRPRRAAKAKVPGVSALRVTMLILFLRTKEVRSKCLHYPSARVESSWTTLPSSSRPISYALNRKHLNRKHLNRMPVNNIPLSRISA